MAKKKLKVTFDSPVVIICALLTVLLYMLDKWALKNFLSQNLLTCLGTSNGNRFDPLSLTTYLRMLLHCFGASEWNSLLINTSFFLLLGPMLEERYGSPILVLMIAASVLVSGVFASFSPVPMTGSYCIVFMMIFLCAVYMLSKKQVQISWILIFLIYLVWTMVNGFVNGRPSEEKNPFVAFFIGNIPTFIDLLAGVCGSLFGFLVAPKPARTRKTASDDTKFTATYSDEKKKSEKRQTKTADSNKFEYIDLSASRNDNDYEDDGEMISVSDLEKKDRTRKRSNQRSNQQSTQKNEDEVIGTIKF